MSLELLKHIKQKLDVLYTILNTASVTALDPFEGSFYTSPRAVHFGKFFLFEGPRHSLITTVFYYRLTPRRSGRDLRSRWISRSRSRLPDLRFDTSRSSSRNSTTPIMTSSNGFGTSEDRAFTKRAARPKKFKLVALFFRNLAPIWKKILKRTRMLADPCEEE